MYYALLHTDGTLDRYPYTLTDLRRAHPNVSWPAVITNDLAATYNVVPVQPTDPGPDDPYVNKHRSAIQQPDGVWVEAWTTTPATAEQISDRIPPDWQGFAAALMTDPGINTMLAQAIATAPALYGYLVVGMGQAAQGDAATFANAWAGATAAGLVSTELAASVAAMAASYDLPPELGQILAAAQEAAPDPKPPGWNPPLDPARGATYQAPDGSWWRWDQPRNPQTGQYLADDPDTPEVESGLDWQQFTP